MPDKNPLGDIAKVFEGLDDTALQSLYDQADAELTLRRTSRVHKIFLSLAEALRVVGHTEKDESKCAALRSRDKQLMGVRVILPFRGNYPVSSIAVWEPVIEVLAANSPEFDFRIQLDPVVCQVRIDFAVPGLKTVPGIPELLDSSNARPPSLTMVIEAFACLQTEGERLQEGAPVADEKDPSTLPDIRGL